MKDFNLLVWFTQLGLGVALPLAGFVYLGVWLQENLDLGIWTIFCGAGLGVLCAINSLRSSLKAMERMSKPRKTETPPPVSFNDHD